MLRNFGKLLLEHKQVLGTTNEVYHTKVGLEKAVLQGFTTMKLEQWEAMCQTYCEWEEENLDSNTRNYLTLRDHPVLWKSIS